MIELVDNLCIGNSGDLKELKIKALLNVACDLKPPKHRIDLEYMQVGLIDGPGNSICVYHAAILAAADLVSRKMTLVYCHSGTRSMAVALMYLNLVGGRGWDEWLSIMREKVEVELPTPHEAHRKAFDQLNWAFLASVIEE